MSYDSYGLRPSEPVWFISNYWFRRTLQDGSKANGKLMAIIIKHGDTIRYEYRLPTQAELDEHARMLEESREFAQFW